jgi:cell wall-associated NlpC family hydrolase
MTGRDTTARFVLCVITVLLVMPACSSMKEASSQDDGDDVPSWFLDDRPMDPYHIFAAATATAPRLQLASSQAANQARGDIAATIATRFQGLTQQYQEEVGAGPEAESVSQFVQTYKSVISQTLIGAEVVERDIQREGDGYRAYVLMRMPIGEAQEELVAQVREGQNTFTPFRASEAFDELEQNVDEYRERQDEQAARRQNRGADETQAGETETNEDTTQEASTDDLPQNQSPDDPDAQDPNEDASAETTESASEEATTGEQPNEQASENPDAPGDASPTDESEAAPSGIQAVEAQVRSAAQPWMDVPYEFGGESKDGVDCSALVRALYQNAFGIELPRTTGRQVDRGRQIARSELRPGDLVFFRTGDQQKHVGVYLDDQEFVHASSSQGVTVSPLQHEYWQEHYWTTRRFQVL